MSESLSKLEHQKSVIEFIRWYQHPDRHYHNLDHIYDCIRHLREIEHLLMNPRSVWLAIWFHDCVYSTLPNAKNEELSAVEARRWVKDEEEKRIITRLILVTKHSEAYPPLTVDECFMCDIDLSSFGAPPREFQLNNEHIREEYRRYDDATYNAGRLEILKGFLKRAEENTLYYTEHFKSKYNERARRNLVREVTRLSLLVNATQS